MHMRLVAVCALLVFAVSCGSRGGLTSSDRSGSGDGGGASQPDSTCGSVRMTFYDQSGPGWCEFDRTLPVLPAFVRSGLTTAIAEPWNGSSYSGEPGEACGESPSPPAPPPPAPPPT